MTNNEALKLVQECLDDWPYAATRVVDIMTRLEKVKELLKEQEAKCLTKAELNDLNENQFVWIEGRTGYLYCLQIIGICRDKTGVSDIQFNAVTSYVEKSTNLYGENYRIWTNKPTEEQKQEVKWDG